jgi:hypothetical protein
MNPSGSDIVTTHSPSLVVLLRWNVTPRGCRQIQGHKDPNFRLRASGQLLDRVLPQQHRGAR